MRLEIRGEYPPDWPAIAGAVKDAAGRCCIRCSHAHAPAVGRCLTVHHLDGDKSNCRWWNLLALCQACHLSVQARVIPERPWLWEHTAWFRPYVAGFYAYYYGAIEITRADADSNAALYLAMGQPWRVEVAS